MKKNDARSRNASKSSPKKSNPGKSDTRRGGAGKNRARSDREKENKPEPIRFTSQYRINRSTELLEFLISKMDLSRNSVKSLLTDHKVLVNGAVTTQYNFPLAKDDEVKIAKNPVHAAPVQKRRGGRVSSPIKSMIIYEDEEFLAINKPHGLLSVESDTDPVSAYAYAVEYLRTRNPNARPYILHRIDRETSGVLDIGTRIRC